MEHSENLAKLFAFIVVALSLAIVFGVIIYFQISHINNVYPNTSIDQHCYIVYLNRQHTRWREVCPPFPTETVSPTITHTYEP